MEKQLITEVGVSFVALFSYLLGVVWGALACKWYIRKLVKNGHIPKFLRDEGVIKTPNTEEET